MAVTGLVGNESYGNMDYVGHGAPETFVTAVAGATYRDLDTGKLYLKASGSAATGWLQEGTSSRAAILLEAPGTLTAATGKFRVQAPFDCTIVNVRASVTTAPTGAALLFDLNKNGTTVFTTQGNRPQIAISGTDSTAAVPDVTALAAGDILTLDVDQIGSTVAGAGAAVIVSVTVPTL